MARPLLRLPKAQPQPAAAVLAQDVDIPKVFFGAVVPLAVGVREQLIERGVPAEVATEFLRNYCNTPEYLAAIERGGARFDLDGVKAGECLPDHRRHARRALKRAVATTTTV